MAAKKKSITPRQAAEAAMRSSKARTNPKVAPKTAPRPRVSGGRKPSFDINPINPIKRAVKSAIDEVRGAFGSATGAATGRGSYKPSSVSGTNPELTNTVKKGRDIIVNQVSEASGAASLGRISEGKGTAGDYATMALMGIPNFGAADDVAKLAWGASKVGKGVGNARTIEGVAKGVAKATGKTKSAVKPAAKTAVKPIAKTGKVVKKPGGKTPRLSVSKPVKPKPSRAKKPSLRTQKFGPAKARSTVPAKNVKTPYGINPHRVGTKAHDKWIARQRKLAIKSAQERVKEIPKTSTKRVSRHKKVLDVTKNSKRTMPEAKQILGSGRTRGQVQNDIKAIEKQIADYKGPKSLKGDTHPKWKSLTERRNYLRRELHNEPSTWPKETSSASRLNRNMRTAGETKGKIKEVHPYNPSEETMAVESPPRWYHRKGMQPLDEGLVEQKGYEAGKRAYDARKLRPGYEEAGDLERNLEGANQRARSNAEALGKKTKSAGGPKKTSSKTGRKTSPRGKSAAEKRAERMQARQDYMDAAAEQRKEIARQRYWDNRVKWGKRWGELR